MSTPATVTSANFDKEVLFATEPVLVDFFAPWSGPCLRISPELEALAVELEGRVKVVKLNIDQEVDLADRFNVMGIPNLVLFKNGQPVDRILGMVSRETIAKTISRHLFA